MLSRILGTLLILTFAATGGTFVPQGTLVVPFLPQVPPGDWALSANCGPTSVLMVADYFAHTKPTSDQIKVIDDWMFTRFNYPVNNYNGSEPTGSDMATLAREYFGLTDAFRYSGWTVAQLQRELSNGYPVIVGVYTSMKPSYGYKHFMVLVGMDANSVYVNDPGRTNGQGIAYPINDFLVAWKANANNAVVVIHSNGPPSFAILGTDLPAPGVVNSTPSILGYQFLSQAFSLTAPVSISGVNLDVYGLGTGTFTLWITNAQGPGTTAANVLLQTSLPFPNTGGTPNGQVVSASTNLLLPPGNYFLILSATQFETQGMVLSTSTLPSTVGTVGKWTATCCLQGMTENTAFPPASTFYAPPISEPPLAFQLLGH